MHESIVFCSTCTMSSQRKFTLAISSPDEFLVLVVIIVIITAAADNSLVVVVVVVVLLPLLVP